MGFQTNRKLDSLRNRSKSTFQPMKVCGMCFVDLFDLFDRFWVIFDPIWGGTGSFFGLSLDQMGLFWRWFWCDFGPFFWVGLGHFGVTLGSFGIILGHLFGPFWGLFFGFFSRFLASFWGRFLALFWGYFSDFFSRFLSDILRCWLQT